MLGENEGQAGECQAESFPIQKAERWFRGLLESAPDAMVICCLKGDIVFVNRQAELMFGYKRSEMLGKKVEMLVPDQFASAHLKHRDKYLEHPINRPMGLGKELMGKKSDGTNFPVEISLGVIDDEDECLIATAIRDITDRKRHDELLRQRQDELSHVGRLTVVGEMASGLAHELNQPLASISNWAKGCQRRIQGLETIKPADVVPIIEAIVKEADRASDLIHRIRRMVMRRPSNFLAFDFVQSIDGALALMRGEIVRRKVQLHIQLPEEPIIVRGDEILLQQVVINLLQNALESLSKIEEGRRVEIRAEEDPIGSVKLQVCDNGVGIPSEQLSNVFEAFHSSREGGMGMGLTICRSIIEAHDGSIAISNNSTRGVTVTIVLPIVRARGHQ